MNFCKMHFAEVEFSVRCSEFRVKSYIELRVLHQCILKPEYFFVKFCNFAEIQQI